MIVFYLHKAIICQFLFDFCMALHMYKFRNFKFSLQYAHGTIYNFGKYMCAAFVIIWKHLNFNVDYLDEGMIEKSKVNSIKKIVATQELDLFFRCSGHVVLNTFFGLKKSHNCQ